jgi:Protein of unknown function (DUF2281)
MTIKEKLLQAIESSPDTILTETLDFLLFLQAKETPNKKQSEEQLTYRPASGKSILRHAGTWEGEDFEECLQSVYATRGKAKFDDENPFE